jgi:hypothetical protein
MVAVEGGEGLSRSPAISAARRLSNPAQEASNFAAEGMAADADALTVHAVLVARLTACTAALQAAVDAGASPDSANVHSLLEEAAMYRGDYPAAAAGGWGGQAWNAGDS